MTKTFGQGFLVLPKESKTSLFLYSRKAESITKYKLTAGDIR